MHELLWLLLPVAAASGWFAAVRSRHRPSAASQPPSLRQDYFRGLNFLINEQPDKAIEVFIRVLEVDHDTVETHLALGNLFRRRGEVDRAIRIHQNLVARQNLTAGERADALLELGQDYMRAGLLDRAEGLFQELASTTPEIAGRALRHLIDIYQQEKDWPKAVEVAQRLERVTGRPYGGVIAHYFCEQAEERSRDGDADQAVELVHRALDISSQCVRASMLEGCLLQDRGDYRGAIRAYKRVEQQDPSYISEVIEPLSTCYHELGRPGEAEEYLSYLLDRYGGITATQLLASMKLARDGREEASRFLTDQLRRRPSVRGLDRLIELSLSDVEGPAKDYLVILKDLTHKLLEDRAVYKCQQCGFSGRSLHWQCPSCKYWGRIKPIQGVEGE